MGCLLAVKIYELSTVFILYGEETTLFFCERMRNVFSYINPYFRYLFRSSSREKKKNECGVQVVTMMSKRNDEEQLLTK